MFESHLFVSVQFQTQEDGSYRAGYIRTYDIGFVLNQSFAPGYILSNFLPSFSDNCYNFRNMMRSIKSNELANIYM